MVRTKSLKRKKGDHLEDDMLRAILMHRKGETLRKAALECKVSYTTLFRYTQKYKNIDDESLPAQRLTPNYEVNRTFTLEQETALKEFMEEFALKFNGLDSKDVRRIAYQMAKVNDIKCPASWEKVEMAGVEWFRSYKSRHPELKVKKSETCSAARASNEETIRTFFDQLKNIKEEDPSFGYGHDDDVEELLKVNDIWSYFNTDGRKASCIVCKSSLDNEYEELKAHLKLEHPKLLLQLMQDKDQHSDAGSNDADGDNDNTYTEIVYLEQEPSPNPRKNKGKSKILTRTPKKRERYISVEEIVPVKKPKIEENDELGTFIKYITCLLRKLPSDVFSNVQAEIISTILKAQNQANSRNIVISKDFGTPSGTVGNVITVDGSIATVSNTIDEHKYSITVAPEVDNS